jgi:hypothetical protein
VNDINNSRSVLGFTKGVETKMIKTAGMSYFYNNINDKYAFAIASQLFYANELSSVQA